MQVIQWSSLGSCSQGNPNSNDLEFRIGGPNSDDLVIRIHGFDSTNLLTRVNGLGCDDLQPKLEVKILMIQKSKLVV